MSKLLTFGLKNIKNFNDLYLKVLILVFILADTFENFRNNSKKEKNGK